VKRIYKQYIIIPTEESIYWDKDGDDSEKWLFWPKYA